MRRFTHPPNPHRMAWTIAWVRFCTCNLLKEVTCATQFPVRNHRHARGSLCSRTQSASPLEGFYPLGYWPPLYKHPCPNPQLNSFALSQWVEV